MGIYQTIILSLFVLFICESKGGRGATFTFVNKCDETVWPGILGNLDLGSTGFELQKGASRSFQAPTGWSGRFWGRTGCKFDGSGQVSCSTGDCGSGKMECDGTGATPPVTLAEFTLGSGSLDFYDVSLVDGYNLPMMVEVRGGSGSCASTGCTEDLNQKCPNELKIEGGGACRSACDAFGTPEYCCKGEYASPSTCSPSVYSQIFKSACPTSYSYAFDDATSTFTCSGADYTITFCPSTASRQKTSKSEGSTTDESGSGAASGSGSASVQEAVLADGSWLANLATGDSIRRHHPFGAAQFWVLVLNIVSLTASFMQI
ncbi:hypothetical protein ACH5RR_013633 [Cinchona calisaya]|uniref:Thaumatin-like protein 1b n=1 Tax=Cinchona calisaya TaxID=153742 RepID=A0ABD3A0K4_9GENT